MVSKVRTHRSNTAGSRPAANSRRSGELYINLADRQIGFFDESEVPRDAIPIRFYTDTAVYAAGDFVVRNGTLLKSKADLSPKAFDLADWDSPISLTGYVLKAGDTLLGPLVLPGAPTLDLQAATKKYVDETVAAHPGVADHTQLTNRAAADAHPMTAITGLASALASLATPAHNGLTGRDIADAHPSGAITGLDAALAAYQAAIVALQGKTHNALTGRDAADAHPLASITGLAAALGAAISDTPPTSPPTGRLWYDTGTTGRMFVWNGTQWVDASPALIQDLTGYLQKTDFESRMLSYPGRNKIINGDMAIFQRNTGSAISPNNTGVYTLDRWMANTIGGVGTGVASVNKVAGGPSGFPYSLKWITTNAKPVSSTTDSFIVYQHIEGDYITDLLYGTANAKTVSLQFRVMSSLVGTFSVAIRPICGSGTILRSYVTTYTISNANTWELKEVVIPGDINGSATDAGNTVGMTLAFDLGNGSYYAGPGNTWVAGTAYSVAGTVRVIGTLNATWQITGVQLEVGSKATPFENRHPGIELALCKRYYTQQRFVACWGGIGGNYFKLLVNYPPMRAIPTVSELVVGVLNLGARSYAPGISYCEVDAVAVATGLTELGAIIGLDAEL
jgi:hypothetical protein